MATERESICWPFQRWAKRPPAKHSRKRFNAACDVAQALGRPSGEVQHTAKVLLEWARDNHREWFYRFEAPAAAAAKSMRPIGTKSRPAIDDGPPLPRHSPRF
jgi:hypothetical protein